MKSAVAGFLLVILVSLGLIPLLEFTIPRVAAEEYAAATEEYEAFDLGADVRKINRGAQNNAVTCFHLVKPVIEVIFLLHAVAVLVFKAFHAGKTAVHRLRPQVDQFGFDPFGFEFLEYLLDENRSVPIFPGTSVKSHYFHLTPSFWVNRNFHFAPTSMSEALLRVNTLIFTDKNLPYQRLRILC